MVWLIICPYAFGLEEDLCSDFSPNCNAKSTAENLVSFDTYSDRNEDETGIIASITQPIDAAEIDTTENDFCVDAVFWRDGFYDCDAL